MRDRFDKIRPYFRWGLTAFIVVACGIMFYFGIDYIALIFKAIGSLIKILSPFIWGLVIAYLLIPPMRYFENHWFKPLTRKIYERHPDKQHDRKLPRILALIMSEIFLLLIIGALIYLIVPQLYESIETIVVNSPEYAKRAYESIDKMLKNNPDVEAYATNLFGTFSDTVTKWAENKALPSMENVVANITTGVYFVIKLLYNLIIGIIVSMYVLNNKSKCIGYAKKMLYCLFNAKSAKKIIDAVKFVDKTFMDFISGKIVDSAIIGVLCYICCLILRMPYALLVSVIIGVLNIIPFFGMYIGTVPAALLILLVSPIKSLVFIGLILGLHLIDNNIIAPKILGNSVGINGFWVIFSIILFGGLFGFWGMLLGVPVFVIIYTAVGDLVNKGLKSKDFPSDAEAYMRLDYIDPETGKPVLRQSDPDEDEDDE